MRIYRAVLFFVFICQFFIAFCFDVRFVSAENVTPQIFGIWNGFLNQINVVECNNLAEVSIATQISLRDKSGVEFQTINTVLRAKQTKHFILNDFPINDRYGTYQVTFEQNSLTPQPALSCLTAFYRMQGIGASRAVAYAYAMPARDPIQGQSAGMFNSINPYGNGLPVYNWLSVLNRGSEIFQATLEIYNQQGVPSSNSPLKINLAPGSRTDIALGHTYGQVVGLYRIVPLDLKANYDAFVVRYGQGVSGAGEGAFNFAFPLYAQNPSCEGNLLPASTMGGANNWAEIGNPTTSSAKIAVDIFDSKGNVLATQQHNIAKQSQVHIFLNAVLGPEKIGSFRVGCSQGQGVILQSMFYGYSPTNIGLFNWAYASQQLPNLQGSDQYALVGVNTFLGAANWLKVFNNNKTQTISEITTYDQSGVIKSQRNYNLNSAASVDSPLHEEFGSQAVGLAELRSAGDGNALSAELLRVYPNVNGGIGTIMRVPAAVVHSTSTDSSPSEDIPVAWESEFSTFAKDANGWSILTPSVDTRLIYVSDSSGNDASGQVYSPTSVQVGSDPFNPSGAVKSFKTISQAMTLVREGYPDWVLLKRGDTWIRDTLIDLKSGRSATERSVFGYYGSASNRPLIKTGTTTGIRFWKNTRYVAVLGVNFYSNGRDPNSADFLGFNAITVNSGLLSNASDSVAPNRTLLIEDCVFNYYGGNIIQGTEETKDVVIRRSQFLNSYSVSSHSQGIFTSGASVLLEENLFDHNGWYKQQIGAGNDQAEGQATYFNHNTYFANTNNTIFRRNVFARASSIGTKFSANPSGGTDQIMVHNLLLDNNLYLEGEIGISAGGNTDFNTGYRWQNIQILNNLFLDLGRARPTNRSLGWGVEATDWDGGKISGNYFLHYGNADVTNVYAIDIGDHMNNLEVNNNLFYNLVASTFAFRIRGAEPKNNIHVFQNNFQLTGSDMPLIDTDYLLPSLFHDNLYTTNHALSSWFTIQGSQYKFTDWQNQIGDSGSEVGSITYQDPNRTVETYNATLGKPATISSFIQELKKQSKSNWRKDYTVKRVNEYLRAGFVPSKK